MTLLHYNTLHPRAIYRTTINTARDHNGTTREIWDTTKHR